MLLKVFKSNNIVALFLLPILTIVLWSDIFMANKENFVPLPYSMPAYAWVMKYLTNTYASSIIALTLIILQAFYLIYINKVYNFISQRTFLTSFLFVLISSAFLNLHYLYPAIIANIFILLSIVEIFSSYRKPKIYKASFNSGFLIAIAGLFYINANFLIIFIFFGLSILHRFNWREWAAVVIGFITPYLITLFLYYFFDKLTDIGLIIDAILDYESTKYSWPLSYYIFSTILFLIGFLSIIKLSTTYSNNKVSTRNYFSLFTILLILIAVIFLIIPFASIELIVIAAVPLSYLISNFYLSKAKRAIQEISFLLIVLSLLYFYMQKYFDLGTTFLF